MIQELMIINEAGIALFYHNFIESKNLEDEQSLASYFDVIRRFTKHSFKESLRTLVLDSYIFYFYSHKSDYHLVLKCEFIDFDKKILEQISETIINSFLTQYKDILDDFNGEITYFKSFSKQVTEILKSKFKDFMEIQYADQ